MGNKKSLHSKIEELIALTTLQRIHWECSIVCLSETSLKELIPASYVALDGFQVMRGDTRAKESGKRKG